MELRLFPLLPLGYLGQSNETSLGFGNGPPLQHTLMQVNAVITPLPLPGC